MLFLLSTAQRERRSPNGDGMKIKSVKEKCLLNRAKKGETPPDVDGVKAEHMLEPEEEEEDDDEEEEEGSGEAYTNGGGLNIQIKEEPFSLEISEEHDGDSSGGVDTKPDVVALGLDGDHRQGDLKEEGDSEFTEAVVKEESESWLKEERDDEQEAADDIQGDYGEGKEEVCTGRRRFFMENVQFLAKYALCYSF